MTSPYAREQPCFHDDSKPAVASIDQLIHFVVTEFDAASLSSDNALALLQLVDYVRAQICAAHAQTLRELLMPVQLFSSDDPTLSDLF
ncbi:MAG: hypothetical protein GY769_03965 [bacterium]|nr:hypothetical protein [bacterium]